MLDTPGTTNSNENDAEKLARLLELELTQKRTVWKQTAAHYRNYPIVRLSIPFHSYRCVRRRLFLSLFARERRADEPARRRDPGRVWAVAAI